MKKSVILGFFLLSVSLAFAINIFVPPLLEKERTEIKFVEEELTEDQQVELLRPEVINGKNHSFHRKWKIVKVYYREDGKMKCKIDSISDGLIHYVKGG